MSIQVEKILDDQYERILQAEEGHFLDLKSTQIQPAKLSKSISAFANADGGEIYIGVDEYEDRDSGVKTRSWNGFRDQEAANAHIQVFESLISLGEDYSCTFLSTNRVLGLVLQVTIHKSSKIVQASDKTIYRRRGAQNLPIKTPEELERLKLDKGIESFCKNTINIEIDLLTTSEVMVNFITAIIPTAEPEAWLKKQQLLQRDKPTIAGVLLFTDEPQAILPKQCGVKIYRYKTKEAEGSRDTLASNPITVEGCIYNQIKEAVSETIKIVEEIPKIGEKGLQSITYPPEAIHEIVTNAILHRDYSILSDIHIRVFDNRIEFESPGKLPGHITPFNILNEQYARNGAIVRIINKFPDPPNKDVGEGLNTAFQAMAKLRLKPPVISEKESSVIVHINHEHLASSEQTIMEYLESNDEITNKIARKITGIKSEATIKTAFYKLKNKNLIELVPGKPQSQSSWRKFKRKNAKNDNLQTSYDDLYAEYEQLVIQYLEEHEEINNQIAREIIKKQSPQTVRNIFNRLRKRGLIEIIPGRPRIKAGWRKVKRLD